jgi:hypothetical protein
MEVRTGLDQCSLGFRGGLHHSLLRTFVLYVRGCVHRESVSIIVQQDATTYSFIVFLQIALHVSDDTFIHHHQEHIQTVITTFGTGRTVFATVR